MADTNLLRILREGSEAWNQFVAQKWQENFQWKADLQSVDLCDANLSHVELRGANLREANLRDANLSHAGLGGANLRGSDLTDAKLTHVDLICADLNSANLSRAGLIDADLREANLSHAKLKVNLSRADLRGADLSYADLSHAKLNEANLSYADLSHAKLNKADLSHAKLTKACLVDADISGADLFWTNLTRANLTRANLSSADLSCADLSCARLSLADLWCTKHLSKLAEADLTGANLRGADLTGADLAGASLLGADLSGAKLAGADITGANFIDVKLTSEEESGLGFASFLDLASCAGIEVADFGNSSFLPDYLSRAFAFAHREEACAHSGPWQDFVQRTLEKIKSLRVLQSIDEPSPLLVQALDTLTTELIAYLKRQPQRLYELDPHTFEEIVAEVLASFGWQVDLTPKSKDGGYDIFALSPNGKAGVETTWLIECKRWAKDRPVGIDVVRALYGANAAMNHPAGMLMLATTSNFTRGSKELQSTHFDRSSTRVKASSYPLALKDYEGILDWLNTYRPNPNGRLYLRDNQLVLPGEDG